LIAIYLLLLFIVIGIYSALFCVNTAQDERSYDTNNERPVEKVGRMKKQGSILLRVCKCRGDADERHFSFVGRILTLLFLPLRLSGEKKRRPNPITAPRRKNK